MSLHPSLLLRAMAPSRFLSLLIPAIALAAAAQWYADARWVDGLTGTGAATRLFGLWAPDVLRRGWAWQCGTHMFLHGNLIHLGTNLLGLVLLGPIVERTMGKVHFFFLYVVSGLAGALCWIALRPDGMIPVVGASGAIMGVFGGFLALYPFRKVFIVFLPFLKFQAWIMGLLLLLAHIVLMLRPEWMGIPVAYEVHIGGLVGGALYTSLVFRPMYLARLRRQGLLDPLGPRPGG
ncbi:MAG: rhomboid family intramembrane serine protease [Kiritimatiellia bacterium]